MKPKLHPCILMIFDQKTRSLRFYLGTAFSLVVVITGILIGILTYVSISSFFKTELKKRLNDSVKLAAMQMSEVSNEELKSLENFSLDGEILSTLKIIQAQNPDISSMRIFCFQSTTAPIISYENNSVFRYVSNRTDAAMFTPELFSVFEKPYKPIVEQQFRNSGKTKWLSGYAPIIGKDGEVKYAIELRIPSQKITDYQKAYISSISGISAGVSLLVILIGLLIAFRISKPLIETANEMKKIQDFDLDSDKTIHSSIIEIDRMLVALENMKNGLKSFKRYVPANLVRNLIKSGIEAKPGGEKRHMSIFFSDIEGFTSLSEKKDPHELVNCLSEYFEIMNKTIELNGGTVDKFIGDSVMAFWNAPEHENNHEYLACKTAVECMNQLKTLNEQWVKNNIGIQFKTRIGISSGDVIVGNIGTTDRLNYTVIGDPVNVSSRLEHLNKQYNTNILISESVFKAANKNILTRDLGEANLRGKEQALKIFELIGLN